MAAELADPAIEQSDTLPHHLCFPLSLHLRPANQFDDSELTLGTTEAY
ncbi:hypothetical protein ACF09J_32670 [Streptomyces sp. NPDC014889]